MKPIRPFALGVVLTMLLAVAYTTVQAQNYVVPKAYMFGFSASFNDSIIYLTDIQEVDSVWFTEKKDMLAGRSEYSSQLRNYCADKLNQPRRTCVVMGNIKLKNVEKKYEKMKKIYLRNKKVTYDVRFIKEEDFRFRAVNMADSSEDVVFKPEKKKKDKAKKEKPKKDGKMPPPPHK